MIREVLRIREKDGLFGGLEWLAEQSDTVEVLKTFNELVLHAYWQERDLSSVLAFGCAGVQYGLRTASLVDGKSRSLALQLRSMVKSIAYNIASFTWPGWDEEGILISQDDLVVGLDASRLNRRLAEALEKGDTALSRADWILGAHYLASEQPQKAAEAWESALRYAKSANSRSDELLVQGYLQILRLIESPGDPAARSAYDDIKSQLGTLTYGEDCVDQLETARRVFTPPATAQV